MKKILTLLFLSFFSALTFAANYSGACGENVTWSLNTTTGEFRVDGMGTMTDYVNAEEVPWQNYRESIKKLVVSEGVNHIGAWTFILTNLTGELSLPSSVHSIGNFAFYGCTGLVGTLQLPENLRSIGSYAFFECSGFTGDLVLPNGLRSVGTNAFVRCLGIDGKLFVPATVSKLGNGAFHSLRSLSLIECEGLLPVYSGTDPFNSSNCPIVVNCSLVDEYRSTPFWSTREIVEKEDCGPDTLQINQNCTYEKLNKQY